MFPGYKFVMVPDYTVPVLPPPQAPAPVIIQETAPRAPQRQTQKGKKRVSFREPTKGNQLMQVPRTRLPPWRDPNASLNSSGGSGTPTDLSRMDVDQSSILNIASLPQTPIRPGPASSLENAFAFAGNEPGYEEPLLRGFKRVNAGDPRNQFNIPGPGLEIDPTHRTLLYKPMNFHTRSMKERERQLRERRRSKNQQRKEYLQQRPYMMGVM